MTKQKIAWLKHTPAVIRSVIDGKSMARIARDLGLTAPTIGSYITRSWVIGYRYARYSVAIDWPGDADSSHSQRSHFRSYPDFWLKVADEIEAAIVEALAKAETEKFTLVIKRITLTLSEHERYWLSLMSKDDFRPPKDEIRWLIRKEAQERSLPIPENDTNNGEVDF